MLAYKHVGINSMSTSIILPENTLQFRGDNTSFIFENGVYFLFEDFDTDRLRDRLEEGFFNVNVLGNFFKKKLRGASPEDVPLAWIQGGGTPSVKRIIQHFDDLAERMKTEMRREIKESMDISLNEDLWKSLVNGTKTVAAWAGNTIIWIARKLVEAIWLFIKKVARLSERNAIARMGVLILICGVTLRSWEVLLGGTLVGKVLITLSATVLVYHMFKQAIRILAAISSNGIDDIREIVDRDRQPEITMDDIYEWDISFPRY